MALPGVLFFHFLAAEKRENTDVDKMSQFSFFLFFLFFVKVTIMMYLKIYFKTYSTLTKNATQNGIKTRQSGLY